MGENQRKDYTSCGLDEYIKDKLPTFMKAKPMKPKYPSQQWRLGRNGPRTLKRLQRHGPLRPLARQPPRFRPNDGLPALVVRRYNHLPGDSVFHRLGWNPIHTIARNRVQMARECMAMKHFNYKPQRRIVSLPMGRRPSRYIPYWYQPNYRQHTRPQRMQYRNPRPNYGSPAFRMQQRIKMQRLHYQRQKLLQMQRSNQQRRPVFSQANQNHGNTFNQPSLCRNAAAARHYPIAKDEYPAAVNVRPPSPEGSIISAISKTYASTNPFGGPVNLLGLNSFAKPRVQPKTIMQNRTVDPKPSLNQFAQGSSVQTTSANAPFSGFRPTPNTTSITSSQRFTTYGMAVD